MAWTGLKNLMHPPHARSDAGGGAKEKANASPGRNRLRRARFLASVLAVPAIFVVSAGMAHAATDILINQEACAIGAAGADAADCPNSLDGPAGGNVRFTAKVIWNTGDAPGTVTVVNKLPIGAIYRSFSGGASCPVVPAAGAPIDASNQTITCTLPAFTGTGDTNAQRVNFLVTLPTVSTGWKNEATVSTLITESDSTNNNLLRGYTTFDAADVALSVVTDPSAEIDPGTPYTQTITVTNHGPIGIPAAGRVVVGFTVPVGAAVTSAGGGSSGWICAPAKANGIWAAGTTVTCTRSGAFANAATDNKLVITGAPNVGGSITTGYSVQGYAAAGNTQMPDGQPDNNIDNGAVVVSSSNTADMTLTKTRGGAATRALGDEVTYTITPRLLGGILPAGAVVTVTDVLPAGLSFVSAAGTGWTCPGACSYTIPAGGQLNYSDLPAITVKATVIQTGAQANTATVGIASGATEVNTANNTSTATVTGSDAADLHMTKTASNYVNGINVAVPLSTPYTYTLSVTNNGPLAIPAAGGTNPAIEITETVYAGVTIQGINAANGWVCSDPTFPVTGPSSFTCTYSAGLAKDASRSLVLNAIRTAEGNAENKVCANFGTVIGTPTRQDSTSGNDCASVWVGASNDVADNKADLSIAKTAGKTQLFAGEDLTYSLTVANAGPAIATNVVLRDQLANLLPSGATLTGISGLTGGQTCTPAVNSTGTSPTLLCQLGTLAVGASQTITVTIKPHATETFETRSNTAEVYSETVVDPVPGNNTATVTTTTRVDPRVDLVASKVVTTSAGGAAGNAKNAAGGSKMNYTVTAKNDGPSSAENVWLRDTLPGNALLMGTVVPTGAGGVCRVVTAATSAGYPVMTGGTLLAAGASGGVLECVWGDSTTKRYLARSAQYEVNYSMRSLPNLAVGTALDNTVTIGTTTDEPNTTNNTATAKVTLTKSELDVMVQMSHNVDAIALGSTVRYKITLKNGGPTYATNVVMTDVFPTTNAGGAASSATFTYAGNLTVKDKNGDPVTDGTCTQPAVASSAGPLTCSFPVLAPTEDRVIEFDMIAAALPAGAMSGTIFHNATVAADETEWLANGDDTAANNSTRDQTSTNRVSENADIGVTKTSNPAAPAKANRGDNITYTVVVTNIGPAASNGAQMVDDLPTGLTFVSATGGTCADDGGKVTCAVGSLAKGVSKTFTIVAKVASNYAGTSVRNKAVVDAPGDPTPGNNESEVETPVDQPPPPPPSSPRGSIGCSVFDDLDQNGIRDAGEAGVAGVTIRLLNAQNVAVASTVTAADGSYSFASLTPGTYTVVQDQPKGYSPTTAVTRQVEVLANQNVAACFGVTTSTQPGSIGCSVFDDADANGTRGPDEKGLGGVTIRLLNDKDEKLATTTTATDGSYSFPDLAPGAYKVSYVLPVGYSNTSPVDRSITVLSGKSASACFGALPGKAKPGSVGCSVFDDADKNGQRNPGEAGLPGITVRLLDAGGKLLSTTTSATDGTYGFPDLAPGTYTVETDLPKGYSPTGSTSRQITVAEGADVSACFGAVGNPGALVVVKTLYEGWNAGAACGTSVAKKELLIVEKIASEHELTWCFAVTNHGTKHLGAPVWADSEYPGMVATAKAGTTLPLAPGATGTWYFEAKHKSSVVNVVGVQMPVTDPAGKLIPDVPPAKSSDDGKATFGMIYDPPYGVKVGTVDGADIINWTMVWVNDNVIAANNVYVSDTVKVPMEFVPGSLSCVGEGATSVVAGTCDYAAGTKTVSVRANFAPDLGKTVANAKNRLFISFKVKVPKTGGSTSYENQGAASWTPPGGTGPLGSVTVFVPGLKVNPIDPKDPKVPTVLPPPGVGVNDPLLGHPDPSNPSNPGNNVETPVLIDPNSAPPEPPKPPPPTIASIPTLSEWGVILLSCLMGLLALRQVSVARRR